MSRVTTSRTSPLGSIAPILLAASILFLASTVRRDLEGGDSAELVTAAACAGIPHATGYPLYVWIGRVAIVLFPGDPALAMNLLSVLFGGAALVLFTLAARELTGNTLSAVLPIAGLALARPFWLVATMAEVYTLHFFLLGATLLFLFRWRRTGSARFLFLAVFAAGLDATHHGSALLLAPAYALFVLLRLPKAPGSTRLLLSLLLLPLAAAVYLHLPLRNAADPPVNAFRDLRLKIRWGLVDANEAGETFADRFRYKVFGAGPRRKFHWTEEQRRENLEALPAYFRSSLGVLFLFAGAAGLLRGIGAGPRAPALLLAWGLAANTVFCLGFRSLDLEDFLVPSLLFPAVAAAIFFEDLRRAVTGRGMRAHLAPLVLLLLVAANGADLLRGAARRGGYAHSAGRLDAERTFLEGSFPPSAHLCLPWGRAALLRYLQVVEGIRPDIAVHSLSRKNYGRAADDLAGRVPLYLEDVTPDLRRRYRVTPFGNLFRVDRRVPDSR